MSNIENVWKKMLIDIHDNGHIHKKDDAEIKELLNISVYIDNPLHHLFDTGFKKENYIDLLKKGVFDIDEYEIKSNVLADYVQSFDDQNMINGTDFVYTYPQRLKAYDGLDEFGKYKLFDQIDIITNRLEGNIGSNRAVAVLYNPGLDKEEEHIPCFNWVQALIRDNSLYLAVMFRSNDILNAFVSNMHFISYIGMSIEDKLKNKYPSLKFDGIYYNGTSCHYYMEFDEYVNEIIKKWRLK